MNVLLARMVLLLFLATGPMAHGWSSSTQTQSVLGFMARMMNDQRETKGEVVRSWDDYDRVLEGFRDPGEESLRMRERYAFVDWPSPTGEKDRVVLVARSPFRESVRKVNVFGQRYPALSEKEGRGMLVWREKVQGISAEWIPEDAFQRWIAKEHITPPVPDTVGSYPHETLYWSRYWADMGLIAAVVVLVAVAAGHWIVVRRKRASPALAG